MGGKRIQALRGNFAQLFASMKLVKVIELSNASNSMGEELSLINGHYEEKGLSNMYREERGLLGSGPLRHDLGYVKPILFDLETRVTEFIQKD